MRDIAFYAFALFALTNSNVWAQDPMGIALSTEEKKFVQAMNEFRAILNLPKLELEFKLSTAAKKHSDYMVSAKQLTHYGPIETMSPWDRMKEEGYSYIYAGENVACGNADGVKVFQQWAMSADHLENMVNPQFTQMGIARSGIGIEMSPNQFGELQNCPFFWTNDFGSKTNSTRAELTDINRIAQAVVMVSGELPAGKSIALPNSIAVFPVAPASTPTSIPSAPSVDPDPATPTPSPIPTPMPMPGPAAVPVTPLTLDPSKRFQCFIPYAAGKNILAYSPGLDTTVSVSPDGSGTYNIKLVYSTSGHLTGDYPVKLQNSVLLLNREMPVATIISTAMDQVSGFAIQVNTATGSGQFSVLGAGSTNSTTVKCKN